MMEMETPWLGPARSPWGDAVGGHVPGNATRRAATSGDGMEMGSVGALPLRRAPPAGTPGQDHSRSRGTSCHRPGGTSGPQG